MMYLTSTHVARSSTAFITNELGSADRWHSRTNSNTLAAENLLASCMHQRPHNLVTRLASKENVRQTVRDAMRARCICWRKPRVCCRKYVNIKRKEKTLPERLPWIAGKMYPPRRIGERTLVNLA